MTILPDIKPESRIVRFDREGLRDNIEQFPLKLVAPIVGMSPTFVKKVVGRKSLLSCTDVLDLLDQDSFGETLVPRSKVISYLLQQRDHSAEEVLSIDQQGDQPLLRAGHALDLIKKLPEASVQCIVTSTPYWALRIYKDSMIVTWADGERCAYGHEQTPEGFLRHTSELLLALSRVLKVDGSIWWNIMDSFNTRTQIRGNAVEALRAMQGKESKGWHDHECRRYSAGHAFLKDGEQCLIPSRIAERASRMGLYVKSIITWAKTSTTPEPQNSRVSRSLEYVIHFSKERTPKFDKSVYRTVPKKLGGRNNGWEADKLSDVWVLPTSSGREGHGAQFPLALPGRCISLTTTKGDLVLDPFVGAGNTGIAATALGCRFIGFDTSEKYLKIATTRMEKYLKDQSVIDPVD